MQVLESDLPGALRNTADESTVGEDQCASTGVWVRASWNWQRRVGLVVWVTVRRGVSSSRDRLHVTRVTDVRCSAARRWVP
jgi:hypothetical protein